MVPGSRRLAREGRGSMLFARTPDELWLELEQDFAAHIVACATDVEVTLTLPPGLGVRERDPYIGEKIDPSSRCSGPTMPSSSITSSKRAPRCRSMP